MRHSKQYNSYGTGVSLMCGCRLVEYSPYILTNWQITNCRFCGMEVQTTGNSPDTDRIEEWDYAGVC